MAALKGLLEARRNRQSARVLAVEIDELFRTINSKCFAQASDVLLKRREREVTRLKGDLIRLLESDRRIDVSSIRALRQRYSSILEGLNRIVASDERLRDLVLQARDRRTNLRNEVSQWALNWQRPIIDVLSQVEAALQYVPRAAAPQDDLQRITRRLDLVRRDLDDVKSVSDMAAAARSTSARMNKILPVTGSHIEHELLRLSTAVQAGHDFFTQGDYSAARRQYFTARKLASEVLLAERTERRKRRTEAKQWLEILTEDARETTLPWEVTSALGAAASGEFLKRWEQVHDHIDKHVMSRACEMGNLDQQTIAMGIGSRQILHWQEKLDNDELTRFAEAVVRKL
jgi:hypothetical protein